MLRRWDVHLLDVFFFNVTATTQIYTYWHTLSLHAALPISHAAASTGRRSAGSRQARRLIMAAVNSRKRGAAERPLSAPFSFRSRESGQIGLIERRGARRRSFKVWSKTMLKKIFSGIAIRSEEHTSELQSLMSISYAGFCLQKKK